MSFITVTEEVERHGLLDLIPGKSQLKVCCERDYGCNLGSVRDNRVRVDHWLSKLGLPDYLSFKSTIMGGIDTGRPEKSIELYVGDSVSFGDNVGGVNQLESTWTPPAGEKFTFACVTHNPRFDISTTALFGVNDATWFNYHMFIGAAVLDGDFFTQNPTGGEVYGRFVPAVLPSPTLTKAHLLQVEWAQDAGDSPSGVWIDGVLVPGSNADTWEDAGTVDYIRVGGLNYKHKGVYIFEGSVNPTDLLNWAKARFPEITF